MTRRLLVAAVLCVSLAACPGPEASGTDASEAGADAAVAKVDAGGLAPDGGLAGHDGSIAPHDAGQQAPDGAVATPDGSAATPDGSLPAEILGHAISPLWGSVVFNEVLIDGTTEGDPNGDGDANPVEDQFVELVNASAAAVALDGFTLVDLDFPDLPRHTFAAYSLASGSAVVVFGGGDAPAATATTTFYTANAADPGLPFGLHLASPADAVLLLDGQAKVVAYFCYGGSAECPLTAASDESLTRSPDLTGGFTPHRAATGANGAAFSAGTRVDGTAF